MFHPVDDSTLEMLLEGEGRKHFGQFKRERNEMFCCLADNKLFLVVFLPSKYAKLEAFLVPLIA